jgi:hypothetical protein
MLCGERRSVIAADSPAAETGRLRRSAHLSELRRATPFASDQFGRDISATIRAGPTIAFVPATPAPGFSFGD